MPWNTEALAARAREPYFVLHSARGGEEESADFGGGRASPAARDEADACVRACGVVLCAKSIGSIGGAVSAREKKA